MDQNPIPVAAGSPIGQPGSFHPSAPAPRQPACPEPPEAADATAFDLARESSAASLTSANLPDVRAPSPNAPPTRAGRHDGWTAERQRCFLEALAATGVVTDACRAAGMSRDAAYAFRGRAAGRAFALAWDAAQLLSRGSLRDDLISRARHGVVDRVYRDGALVAERHHYDNRLSMAVLTRLDTLAESKSGNAPAVRAIADEFDQFLDIVASGNAAAEAFLTPRLLEDQLEPPQFRGSRHAPGSEPALLARLSFHAEHGVGIPSDIPVDDIDLEAPETWTDDEIRRAEASTLLASLAEEDWPDFVREGEADGTDGMCKLRKLYQRLHPSGAAPAEDEEGDDYGFDDEE